MDKAANSIIYKSPTAGELTLRGLINRITAYTNEAPENCYRLMIGTDSVPSHHGRTLFVTAIVVHRVGRGGIYFWHKNHHLNTYSLRNRMYEEALISIETARLIISNPLASEFMKKKVEIHLDIGEAGDTREMIKEIVGMVIAHGFHYQIKPFSYAASKVADRHTVLVD